MDYRKNLKVLNILFNAVSRPELIKIIETASTLSETVTVSFTNVSGLVSAHRQPTIIEALNSSTINAVDGMPICWIGKFLGIKDCERNSGPDPMKEIITHGLGKGWRHFFYGTTEETLSLLNKKLIEQFPGINIVGMFAPPFRELTNQEDKQIINTINRAKPDYVWIGLGAPKQDIWMMHHKSLIQNCRMLGVGAAFNFFAGTVNRSPKWMSNHGLEWLYRFISEPRRLWKRYLIGNILFIYYLLTDIRSTYRIWGNY
ncbi:glycosyl transferase [Clostridia bacterium]|nr:glycosyl transferase [Clostridia bacterium]